MSQRSTSSSTEPTLAPNAPKLRLRASQLKPAPSGDTGRAVTLIGSRPDCQLVLNKPEISKLHCALVNTRGGVIVVDLCSRTGTTINGERVTRGVLRPGDVLGVGGVAVETELAAGEYAAESPLASLRAFRLVGAAGDHAIDGCPAIIGRRQQCQAIVDTPDVSLTHAMILELEGCPAILDLGSRSGTHVDDERVHFAWLRNGQRLAIGGEELRFEWDGPEFTPPQACAPADAAVVVIAAPAQSPPPAAKLAENAPRPAPAAPKFELNLAGGADPDDIGGLLGSFHAQVGAVRARLETRAAELHGRESELEKRNRSLADREQALETARVRLGERVSDLDAQLARLNSAEAALAAERKAANAAAESERGRLEQRATELEQQAQALQAERESLEAQVADLVRRREELVAAQQAIDTGRGDLGHQAESLAAERAALAEQRRTLETDAELLRTREVACDARRRELEERAADLDRQQAALEESRSAEADATRKIEQFKAALREASDAFAGMTPACAAPADRLAAGLAASDARSGNGAASSTLGDQPSAPTPIGAPKPGAILPLVAEPLFGVTAATQDLPPEVVERLRVLRRVSRKSDNELLAQVLAEFEAVRSRPAPSTSERKGKRWWSS